MGIKIRKSVDRNKLESSPSNENFFKRDINIFGSAFSNKRKERFYSELGVLLKSGINLKQALDIISESQERKKDQSFIACLSEALTKGKAFSEALGENKNFSLHECKAVQIGEQTGQLSFITEDIAKYYFKRNEQKKEIVSSLTYPVIVLITATIVVLFMLKYVVPMFEDIFKQNHVELPFLTQIVVSASFLIKKYGLYFISLIFTLILFLKVNRKKNWYRRYSDILLLKLPLIGNYVTKIHMTSFIHTMMLLTNSKIPVANALGMVKELIRFWPLKESIESIEMEIIKGEPISESFAKHAIFDKKFIALLRVAEETNQTEYVFRKLYDQYAKELEYYSKTMASVLNPILTLLVGFIVGIILIAMYLPMFSLSNVLG